MKFIRILTIYTSALWLLPLLYCRSFDLSEEPGPPSSKIEGTYHLIPATEDMSFIDAEIYMTGILQIKKTPAGLYELHLMTKGNALSYGMRFQSESHWTGGEVQTSKNEIVVKNTLYTLKSRRYAGAIRPLDRWEDKFEAARDVIPEQQNYRQDLYFKSVGEGRFKFRAGKLHTKVETIFKKIPPAAPKAGRGGRPSFIGSVFRIGSSSVTANGSKTANRVRVGRPVIVYRKGVIARGRVTKVYPRGIKFRVSSGKGQIKARDLVYAY